MDILYQPENEEEQNVHYWSKQKKKWWYHQLWFLTKWQLKEKKKKAISKIFYAVTIVKSYNKAHWQSLHFLGSLNILISIYMALCIIKNLRWALWIITNFQYEILKTWHIGDNLCVTHCLSSLAVVINKGNRIDNLVRQAYLTSQHQAQEIIDLKFSSTSEQSWKTRKDQHS